MGKYVKIKRAKNLRFRLISVLYLLFISLSIIQIPIEWLRVNPYYSKYFRSISSKDSVAPEIQKAITVIDAIDSLFVAKIGFDKENNTIIEPSGYSGTDKFFIVDKKATSLFQAIVDLKKYYLTLDEKHPKRKEFLRLFKGDLENGIEKEKELIWMEWKFKHVPATITRMLLAELKLRCHLLNGAIDLDTKGEKAKQIVRVAVNVDMLQLGDTATFVIGSEIKTDVQVSFAGKIVNEQKWKGDTLFFIPKSTGDYKIKFMALGMEDILDIKVLPTTFLEENGESVHFFFEGKQSSVKYTNVGKIGNVKCDCASSESIKIGENEIFFTPNKEGWCFFNVTNTQDQDIIADSVYVQPLPQPILIVENTSASRISKSRLLQQKSIIVTATHPDMDNFNYDIESMEIVLIGNGNVTKTINGASISLTAENLETIKYVQIKQVNVSTAVKQFKLSEPLLIEIL